MHPLILVALLIAGALAAFALIWRLERRYKRPGLTFAIGAAAGIAGAALNIVLGERFLAALAILNAIGCAYHARWQWSTTKSSS